MIKIKRLFIAAILPVIGSFISFPVYADNGVPPVLNTSWTPDHTPPGGTVQLRFDIGNPGTTAALTGVAFDDVLPAGLTVGNIGAVPIGCGIVSATAPSTIHYTAGVIPANTSSTGSPCNFEINITTSTGGIFTNTTTTILSNQGGSGPAASADLTVGNPPAITTSFGAATAGVGQSVSLTFTLSNPSTGATVSGLGFIDSLPSGLAVSTPNGASNTCGGTLTATAGSHSVQLGGASLAASASCTVVVNVTGTSAGTKNNSVQVTSTNLGNGNTSNTSITELLTPAVSSAFGASSVAVNGSTSLTFTITNPNGASAMSGISLSDTLPAGLVVSTPNGLAGTCLTAAGAVTAGGSVTAAPGSGSISISGLGLASSGSCSFAVSVTGTTSGLKTNTTGTVTSTNAGTGNTTSATLTVDASPAGVPSLTGWGMAILVLGLVFVASRTRTKWSGV